MKTLSLQFSQPKKLFCTKEMMTIQLFFLPQHFHLQIFTTQKRRLISTSSAHFFFVMIHRVISLLVVVARPKNTSPSSLPPPKKENSQQLHFFSSGPCLCVLDVCMCRGATLFQFFFVLFHSRCGCCRRCCSDADTTTSRSSSISDGNSCLNARPPSSEGCRGLS